MSELELNNRRAGVGVACEVAGEWTCDSITDVLRRRQEIDNNWLVAFIPDVITTSWVADVAYAATVRKLVLVDISRYCGEDARLPPLLMLSAKCHRIALSPDCPETRLVAAALRDHTQSGSALEVWGSADLAKRLMSCESPAEARMLVALSQIEMEHPWWNVCTQVPLLGGKYRADITLDTEEDSGVNTHRVCIEVDGHDWHERTKQQAQRDKSRDRELQAAGWRVLRFTGSEVWGAPSKCANEVGALLSKLEDDQ